MSRDTEYLKRIEKLHDRLAQRIIKFNRAMDEKLYGEDMPGPNYPDPEEECCGAGCEEHEDKTLPEDLLPKKLFCVQTISPESESYELDMFYIAAVSATQAMEKLPKDAGEFYSLEIISTPEERVYFVE